MTELEAYNGTKKHLQDLLGRKGYIPNIVVIDNTTRMLAKKIKIVENGAQVLSMTLTDVEESTKVLQELRGKHRAFKEILTELRKKIKEVTGGK